MTILRGGGSNEVGGSTLEVRRSEATAFSDLGPGGSLDPESKIRTLKPEGCGTPSPHLAKSISGMLCSLHSRQSENQNPMRHPSPNRREQLECRTWIHVAEHLG